MGETLEDGTTLGNLSGTLEQIGVQVLDVSGNMRDMGDIIEDLMRQWGNFDTGEKQALAVKLAGKYQYNRLLALLENSQMYFDTLEESEGSEGFLQRTQDIYMESLEAKSQSLAAAFEGLTSELFDPDDLKPFLDGLTNVVSMMTNLVNAIGGGDIALAALGATATRVFSNNIGRSVSGFIENRMISRSAEENAQYNRMVFQGMGMDPDNPHIQSTLDYANKITAHSNMLSDEQIQHYNQVLERSIGIANEVIVANEQLEHSVRQVQVAYALAGNELEYFGIDSSGNVLGLNDLRETERAAGDVPIIENNAVQETKRQLEIVSQSISRLGDDSSKLDKHLLGADGGISRLKERLGDSSPIVAELKDHLKGLSEAFDENTGTAIKSQAEIERLSSSFQKTANTIIDSLNEMIDSNVKLTAGNISQLKDKVQAAGSKEEVNDVLLEGEIQKFDTQIFASNVVSVIGSLGQLYTVMSSLASLSDIWSNEDTSFLDKLGATVQNLLFTLPMMISSFVEINNASKRLVETGVIERVQKELNTKAVRLSTEALQANTVALKTKNFASRLGNNIVKIAIDAFRFVVKNIGKLAVGGIIADLIFSFIDKTKEEIRQRTEKQVQDNDTKMDELKQQISSYEDSNFNTLNSEYKQTGKATDEFISTLEKLGEVFGITDTKILLATKNYETLATEIERAALSSYKQQALTAEQQIYNLNRKYKDKNTELNTLLGMGGSSEEHIVAGTESSRWNDAMNDFSQSVIDSRDSVDQFTDSVMTSSKIIDLNVDADAISSGVNTYIVKALNNMPDPTFTEEDTNNLGSLLTSILTDEDTAGAFISATQTSVAESDVGESVLDLLFAPLSNPELKDKVAESFSQDPKLPASIVTIVNDLLGLNLTDEQKKALADAYHSMIVDDSDAIAGHLANMATIITGVEFSEKDFADAQAAYLGYLNSGEFGLALSSLVEGFIKASGIELDSSQLATKIGTATEATIAQLLNISPEQYDTSGLTGAVQTFINNIETQGLAPAFATLMNDLQNVSFKNDKGETVNVGEVLSNNPEFSNSFANLMIALLTNSAVPELTQEEKAKIKEKRDRVVLNPIDAFFKSIGDFWTWLNKTVEDFIRNSPFGFLLPQSEPAPEQAEVAPLTLADVIPLDARTKNNLGGYNSKFAEYYNRYDNEIYGGSIFQHVWKTALENDPSLDGYALAFDLVAGFSEGIQDGAEGLHRELDSVLGEDLVNYLCAVWGIHSPSRVAQYIADMVGKGYIAGLEGNKEATQSAMDDIFIWDGDYSDLIPEGYTNVKGKNQEVFNIAAEKYGYADQLEKAINSDNFADKIAALGNAKSILENVALPDARKGLENAKNLYKNAVELDMNERIIQNAEQAVYDAQAVVTLYENLAKRFGETISNYNDLSQSLNNYISGSLLQNSEQLSKIKSAEEFYGFLDTLNPEMLDQFVAIQGGWSNALTAMYNMTDGVLSEQVSADLLYDAAAIGYNERNIPYDENGVRANVSASSILSNRVGKLGLSEEETQRLATEIMTEANASEVSVIPDNINWLIDTFAKSNTDKNLTFGAIRGVDFSNSEIVNNRNALAQAAFDSYLKNLNSTFNRDANLAKVEVEANAGKSIVSDLSNDTLTNKSLSPLVIEEVADAFEDAANKSDAFAESLSLLGDQSYNSQLALMGIDSSLEDIEHAIQLESIDELRDALESVENDNLDLAIQLGLEIDNKELDDIQDDLQDQIKKQQFTLDIDVGGDLIDTADSMIEAMGDVSDAASKIGEGFQVSVDDIDDLASAFPGILDGAELVENGIIQLNEGIVRSVLDTAGISIDASAKEQAAKLEAYSEYAQYMSEIYARQAQAYSVLAQENQETNTEAQQAITDTNGEAAEASEKYYGEQSDAAQTSFKNQSWFGEDGASSISVSMADADKNTAANYMSMSQNAYVTFSGIANMARYAAAAVSEIGEKNPTIGDVPNLTTSLGGAGTGSVGKKEIRAGDTITIGGNPITVGPSQANIDAANNALLSQALSEAYLQASSDAKVAALQLRGGAGQSLAGLGGAGIGSGGSGGGGGGGGGGDSYEPKVVEITEKELDRYEKVDTALDSISNELDKLSAAQDRLVGNDLLKNLEDQISLLNQQVEIQKEKLSIQKEELAEYDKRLASEFGVTFKENGLVANYKERFQYYLGYLNELERQYNAATTEEAQEALQEQIDAAKAKLDEYEDLIDKRDDLFSNSIRESEKAIEDYFDQVEDMMIDTFNKSLDAIDSIKELNDTMAELRQIGKGLRSDNPFREIAVYLDKIDKFSNAWGGKGMFEAIIGENNKKIASGELSEQQVASLQGINKIYGAASGSGAASIPDMWGFAAKLVQQEIAQYKSTGSSGIFGENGAALMEAAKTIFQGYADAMQEWEQQYEELEDKLIDAIDHQNEKIERQLGYYEEINAELEHQYNLIEKTKGEEAYDDLIKNLAAQRDANAEQIKYHQQAQEYWQSIMDGLETGSDAWLAARDNWVAHKEAIDELSEASVELINSMRKLASDKSLDKMAQGIFGTDLEWAQEQWELINRNADQYLDDVNAAYETQRLQGRYMDLLDGSDNLAVQRKITEQMDEQLGYLREKEKLSEYDVAYANAQLEILQKQIALEEARRNKSQMQLRRDSQGNFSYVYTADENNVKGAQDELLDAQNNAYNLTKDNIVAIQSDMLSAVSDAQQRISEIQDLIGMSQEEKAKRIKEIVDGTVEYIEGLSEQLGESNRHIVDDYLGMVNLLGEENAARLEDTTAQVVAGNDEALNQIDERFSTSITGAVEDIETVKGAFNDMYDELNEVNTQHQQDVADITELAGDSYDEYTQHILDCLEATKELTDGTREFFDILKDESGIMANAQDALAKYSAMIADSNNAQNAHVKVIEGLRDEIADLEAQNADLSNSLTIANNGINGEWLANGADGKPGSGAGGDGSGSGGYAGTPWDMDTLIEGVAGNIWVHGSWLNDPVRAEWLTRRIGAEGAVAVQEYVNLGMSALKHDWMTGYYDQFGYQRFDTGGYTGNWFDNEGRFAMLHKKELVLNATDTQNILAAVDAVRSVASTMKAGAFDAIVSNVRSYGKMFEDTNVDFGSLEQNVHIDAEFPNVYNAEDVRDALLGLSEQAMQYANRRRK